MSTPKNDNVQTALDRLDEAEYRDEIGEPNAAAAARRAEAQVHATLAVAEAVARFADAYASGLTLTGEDAAASGGRPCAAGCGCRHAGDPDRRECACGGECCTDPNWPTRRAPEPAQYGEKITIVPAVAGGFVAGYLDANHVWKGCPHPPHGDRAFALGCAEQRLALDLRTSLEGGESR